MERGDVVRVQLPPPAGPSGKEQYGVRPAVVVQEEESSLPTVVIVPFTSNRAASRFPGSLLVSATRANGLEVESVALTHQIRAIDKRRIEGVIGKMAPSDMAALEQSLRGFLRL